MLWILDLVLQKHVHFQVFEGHVCSSSLIHDMLRSPVVSESLRFHRMLTSALLEKVRANIKGENTLLLSNMSNI